MWPRASSVPGPTTWIAARLGSSRGSSEAPGRGEITPSRRTSSRSSTVSPAAATASAAARNRVAAVVADHQRGQRHPVRTGGRHRRSGRVRRGRRRRGRGDRRTGWSAGCGRRRPARCRSGPASVAVGVGCGVGVFTRSGVSGGSGTVPAETISPYGVSATSRVLGGSRVDAVRTADQRDPGGHAAGDQPDRLSVRARHGELGRAERDRLPACRPARTRPCGRWAAAGRARRTGPPGPRPAAR